jgi:hypothetical protein
VQTAVKEVMTREILSVSVLTKSPRVFMSLMNGVFREYMEKFVQVFIDDMLIFSWMEEDNDEHLRLVL